MSLSSFTVWQKFCLISFSVLGVFVNFTYFSQIASSFMIALIVIFFLYDIIFFRDIKQLLYILFLVLLFLIGKGLYVPTAIVCMGLIFMSISYEQIVYVYRFSLTCQVVVGIFLSLVGVAPLKRGNVFTLGFNNENVLGIVLLFLSLTLLVEEKNNNGLDISKGRLKWLIFLIINLFVIIALNDYTAAICSIVFLLSFIFKNVLERQKSIIKFIVTIIPLVVSYVAIYIGKNYPFINMPFTNRNMFIRFSTWNAYFNEYHINFWPQKVIIPSIAYDGSYTYLLTFSGWFITAFFVVGLMISNYKLLSKNHWVILIILIAIEVGSFSENYLVAFATNFAMVLMIKGYNYQE